MARIEQMGTAARVITPENVSFRYELAGPFVRFIAYLIDLLIMGVLCILFFLMAVAAGMILQTFFNVDVNILNQMGLGVYLIFLFVLTWGYGGLLETFWNGQTVGKRALGLRVVSVTGVPINGQQAILRNILRSADVLFYMLGGFLSCTFSDHFQRLGDLAAQTMVIVEKQQFRRKLLQLNKKQRQLVDLVPPIEADPKLSDAIGSYVASRGRLSANRRREIAKYLAVPFIKKWELDPDTDYDLLICAIYVRIFLE